MSAMPASMIQGVLAAWEDANGGHWQSKNGTFWAFN
jgi:hypothetical protein